MSRDARSPWLRAILPAAITGILALLSNITTEAQLTGQEAELLTVRLSLSKFINAGAIWAGLAIWAGWCMTGKGRAAVAGPLACTTALLIHYGLGQALSVYDSDVWASNAYWFVAAVILGIPLGLVGAIAHRPGPLGWIAALVAPAGVIAEPFAMGMFTSPAGIQLPWPGRLSSIVSGTALVACGTLLAILVARHRHSGHTHRPALTPSRTTEAPRRGRRTTGP